jgi:hypothetical protein
MNKLHLLASFVLLAACSTLKNAPNQLQPVTVINSKENILFTTCSGMVESWGSCNSKAMKECKGRGYEILDRFETPAAARRELTFKCK